MGTPPNTAVRARPLPPVTDTMTAAPTRRLLTLIEIVAAVLILEKGSTWINAGLGLVGLALPLMPLFRTTYVGFTFTILVWLWLRKRGERWADFGLAVPRSWRRYVAWGVLLVVVALAWSTLVQPSIDALMVRLTGANPKQAEETFASVTGNLPLYLYTLPCILVFGVVGEELFYRGYLLTRIEGLLGNGRAATIGAVVAQAIVFSLGHWYQGAVGMVGVGVYGLIYGIGARAWGRTLVPGMVAHGLLNFIAFTLFYLGLIGKH